MRLFQRGKRGIWWVDVTIAGQFGDSHRLASSSVLALLPALDP